MKSSAPEGSRLSEEGKDMAILDDQAFGVALAGLIMSIVSWLLFGVMWLRCAALEKRLHKTIDEDGIVRKNFLPGEVFTQHALTEDTCDKNFDMMLGDALAELRVSLDTKLADSEGRILKDVKKLAEDFERTRKNGLELASSPPMANGTRHHFQTPGQDPVTASKVAQVVMTLNCYLARQRVRAEDSLLSLCLLHDSVSSIFLKTTVCM